MILPPESGVTPVYLPSPVTTSTNAGESTFYQGPAAPGGSDGPPLDTDLLEAGYIPQGQGYDGTNTLLGTYNKGDEVRLTLQDRYSGAQRGNVILGGQAAPPFPSTEGMSPQAAKNTLEIYYNQLSQVNTTPPGKGGGVAIEGDYIYVADTEAVYVYSRSAVEDASDGSTVNALDVITMPDDVRASYLTVENGKLYVGEYQDEADFVGLKVAEHLFGSDIDGPGGSEIESPKEQGGDFVDAYTPDLNSGVGGFLKDVVTDPLRKLDTVSPIKAEDGDGEKGPLPRFEQAQLHVFDIDPNGSLVTDGDGDLVYDSIEIPQATQGVAVTETGYLFTRSYGSKDGLSPRELVFQPFSGGEAAKVADIDYYAEGLNIVGDEVWITYESAATEYAGKADQDRDHIQRIPLDSLDIGRTDLGA